MRIVICGSLNFSGKTRELKTQLDERGHRAVLPQSVVDFDIESLEEAEKLKNDEDTYLKIKPEYTRDHFEKIRDSDAVLVVNERKKGIDNYIGGATFAEMMVAFHYGEKIFLWNPIPKNEKLEFFVDEIEMTGPVVLDRDLELISDSC